MADKLFQRKLGLKADAGVGNSGGDAAREGFGDRLQVDVKMIGLEEPVFAAIAAVQRNPIHGAFGELAFPRGVAAETDARDHGMLEARAHGRSCFVEVAAREVLFEGRGANGDAIEFNGGAGGLLVICSLSAKTRDGQHSRNKAAQRVSSEREALRGPRREHESVYNLPQSVMD